MIGAALAACDGTGSSGSGQVDERVVIHEALDPGMLTFASEPAVHIGETEGQGPEVFGSIRAGARLSTGDIVVLDSGDATVRVFDGDGRHRYTVGGDGEGPGEFRLPGAVQDFGDGFAVWDNRLHRLTTYEYDGRLRNVTRVEVPGEFMMFMAARADGGVMARVDRVTATSPEIEPMYSTVYLFDQGGMLVDSLPPMVYGLFGVVNRQGISPVPGSLARFAAGRDVMWYGSNSEPELRQFGLDGSTLRVIRIPDQADRPTRADVEALATEMARGIEQLERNLRNSLSQQPLAARFPTHGDLRLGSDQSLWMEEYRRPGAAGATRWIVFEPDGRLRGGLALPGNARILDMGSDWILLVVQDEIGVEYVQLRSLGHASGDSSS